MLIGRVRARQSRTDGADVVRDDARGRILDACLSSRLPLQRLYPPKSGRDKGGLAPPWIPRRGKDVRTQGVSVRATRKPLSLNWAKVEEFLARFAERRVPGSPVQAPPRITRRLQSPLGHALPSVGEPA